MQARALVFAAALIVGAAAFAPRPSPTTVQRFMVAETNHQVVDLSSFGQPEQTTHIVTSTYVTVTSSDSAGGKAVKLVIDSVHADSVNAPGFDPSVLDSLRGVIATGWVAANGRLQNVQADTLRGGQAGNVIRAIFPRMDPRAKVGDRWTDTSEVHGLGGGMLSNATTKRITNWAVTSEQMMGGVKARKVESAFSQSVTGTVNGPQGSMAIDGTGTGTATYFVAPDGRDLGVTSSLTLQIAITIPQAADPIPVNGTITAVVTPIR